MSLETSSHIAHENWYDKKFPDEEKRLVTLNEWKRQQAEKTINYWLHERMLNLADVLAQPQTNWVTVGDGFGFDANYLMERGCQVTATDIAGTFLPLAQKEGFIHDFSVENVERLTFEDNTFDYALCKEAYHHFPRPYLGVYEMLRVVKNGIMLIEPHDPISRMPLLLALRNIFDRFNPSLLQKYWKNRYSFEEVGNYVFKLSEREMEKLAMGLNLPAVAFKGINNNYYNAKTAGERADKSSKSFRKIESKLVRDNLVTSLGFMPHQLLCAIIFKKTPDENTIENLRKSGFTYYLFPKNPYL